MHDILKRVTKLEHWEEQASCEYGLHCLANLRSCSCGPCKVERLDPGEEQKGLAVRRESIGESRAYHMSLDKYFIWSLPVFD